MYQISRNLVLIWSDLLHDRLFQLGLTIKIVLLLFLVPVIQQEWFVSFIINSFEHVSFDPWTDYQQRGGDILAFPYGPAMLVAHLPTTFIGWWADNLLGTDYLAHLGFRLSLLGADFAILIVLLQLYENYWKKIILYYWLSPLVIFITYWHGQTDIIPVSLFFVSLGLLTQKRYYFAGTLLAFAVAAKHSMIIGIPFILLYIWSKPGARNKAYQLIAVFAFVLLIIEGPLLYSEGFQAMVIGNKEADKLFWLSLNMGKGAEIYLTPLLYFTLFYYAWRLKRMNFDLMVSVLGVAFSIIIMTSPAPPGWILWVIPVYVIHQTRAGINAAILVSLFSLVFITYHFLHITGVSIIILDYIVHGAALANLLDQHLQSILYTLVISLGVLVTFQILREGIKGNDYYHLGKKPVVIGIAGNTGAGKGHFAYTLATLFGERSVAYISENDYQSWGKESPMKNVVSHMDPRSNRLLHMVNDIKCLLGGATTKARTLDKKNNHFTTLHSVKDRNIIIVSGLHTMFPRQLIEDLDVKFFLDMNKELYLHSMFGREASKEHEILKEEVDKQEATYEKFIKPQIRRSDVVFHITAVNLDLLKSEVVEPKLQVQVRIKNGIYYHELVRVLVGVCGLRLNVQSVDEKGGVVLEIEGDVESDDIRLAVFMLLPHMEELLDESMSFKSGVEGIMQLVALIEINEELNRRRSRV